MTRMEGDLLNTRYNPAHEISLSCTAVSLRYVCGYVRGGYDLHGASGESAGGGTVRGGSVERRAGN